MASDNNDEVNERLIEDLRPRLRRLIDVRQVLDYLNFIDNDQKELIRQKEKNDGNRAAVDLLINAVTKRPHEPGWYRAFVDALVQSGCLHAADYMQGNVPDPQVEEENDYRVKLIQLMSPTLKDMKTEQVRVKCLSLELLTQDDAEIVDAITRNDGPSRGAGELLRRIVRGRPQWFSQFLLVLRETEHELLYRELTGEEQGSDDKTSVADEPTGTEGVTEERPAQAESCETPQLKDGSRTEDLQDESAGSDDKTSVEDEPTGTEGVTEERPAQAESCETPQLKDGSRTEDLQDESADLYRGASTETSELLPNSLEPLQSDGTPTEAADIGPGRDNIVLRDYQMEVARPALEGKNIIICLPTGSGKTRVAVYITQKHLDGRRAEGQSGKVVVLVNKIPLVEQHYSSEFLPFLRHTHKVERVSGDSELKISFTEIVKKNDVIICTAQILENYLERSNKGDDEGINLSDLTLIIIDECHHTQKGEVYNHIMMRYLKQKHKNMGLKKEQKQTVPLPQILGLTASPGVGSATRMEKAEEHILRICANLDASKIMTSSLGGLKKEPRKNVENVEDRKEDPFGDVIKKIMNCIHAHADLSPTCDLGSQNYEQWVVQKERIAATEENQKVRVCTEHLRQYNQGLDLCNTIRMQDALSFLNKYYEEEIKKKTTPDEEQTIKITDTERFLINLFKENKEELKMLSENPVYENDSLSKLRAKILQEVSTRETARGIIFTKTRRTAIALSQWIQENPKFADIGVKASHIIGGGAQSVVKPMTSAEQKDVLTKFGNGQVNLLIATSVAEEGLDITACNYVILYGLVTNEIAMIQTQGRGRAEDSTYTIIEVKNSGVTEKDYVNEYRKNMMYKAINKIRDLDQVDYEKRIKEFQSQAIMENRVRNAKKKEKDIRNGKPSEAKFRCRGCNKDACSGEDIEIIEDMHRVNLTPQFRELFNQTENTTLQERRLDYNVNGFIACKDCGSKWGSMMSHRGMECPCLDVKNFVVWNGKKTSTYTKWSELAVKFPAFDYADHASRLAQSSDDEDA